MSEVKVIIDPKIAHYPDFSLKDVENWTPALNPDPSYDFMIALYLEYFNDYITTSAWSRAHHINPESGRVFIDSARAIMKLKSEVRDTLKCATDPHF